MRNKTNTQPKDAADRARLDENATCDACGRFGAFDFGGSHLCEDCYETRGSCCLEFGADDLWVLEENAAPQEGGSVSPGSGPSGRAQ